MSDDTDSERAEILQMLSRNKQLREQGKAAFQEFDELERGLHKLCKSQQITQLCFDVHIAMLNRIRTLNRDSLKDLQHIRSKSLYLLSLLEEQAQ